MSTYTLKREIPIEDEFDLVVAGGGPAGTAAAVCAARLGAKVLLLEATGCLGGMGTSGLVTTFGPVSDGKQMLVGGLMKQIVLALQQRGQLGPHVVPEYLHSQLNRWVPFKPEGLKRLLDELVQDAGVDVRFFTRVIDAEVTDTKIDGVVISNVEGYRYIRAKTYIDATGDAALSDLCGAECKVILRDIDAVAPSTLCSLYSGVNWDDPAYGEDWRGIDAAKALSKKLLLKAIDDEHFTQPDRFMPGMNKIGKQAAQLNGGHVFNLNGLDVRSLSDGMIFGRKLAVEYESFFRKYMPGCENIELLTTAPVMGVRDTRRIVGEFELLFEDYTSGRQFPDQIAVYNRPTDVHPTDTSEKEFKRFTQDFEGKHGLGVGQSLGIPYSILVPKGWTNLWVAGRCHSSDTKVHGSIRAQSAAYMMGQAAGTAAVQSIATGQPACDLDTEDLVLRLREQGANLPQATLSKTMTR
ncbi:FAD-dependent oxidoreductase [Methylocella sp. CPCC 101449]|uniref:FAD-dependent oxidoreductase n=1 Tax=Methylocella sp. CPCC 101449 TaxID=2987531 RepID=UPI0028920647|nr:FAD-dependent oxidoreductase [Methylocella sp. CPCC 101449]MDT2021918.1 FAD-dependent oxidoreductase [Methylocella sp. CPCC 101449]